MAKTSLCAAASALAISAVNGIDALAGVTPIVEANNEEGGYLLVKLVPRLTQEQSNISQDSFRESIDWSAICSRRIQRLYPNQNNQRKLGGASHVDENEFAILRSQKRWRFYF